MPKSHLMRSMAPMSRSSRTAFVIGVVVVALASPGAAAEACAAGHLGLRWTGFPAPIGDFGPAYLYWVVEPASGETTVPMTIRANDEGNCSTPPQPATATYAVDTPPGTDRGASSLPGPLQDYETIVAGNTGPLYDHRQPPNQHTFSATVRSDELIETVVEQARARITFTDGIPTHPQNVPLWIIDSDGVSRASLESAGPYRQEERFRDVVIPVFRAGSDISGQLSVGYAIEGTSPAPADSDDYVVTSPNPLVFGSNERIKLITLSLRADGVPEGNEQAAITLTTPGPVLPADVVSATLEIIDSAGGYADPVSRLHHPRNKKRYGRNDYRLREIHVFTERGGGGSVVEAEIAIRMNRKGGRCAWLAGRRFRSGPCDEPVWLGSDGRYEADLYYFRLGKLRPTRKKIKSYTAFSRATDTSRNVEFQMESGRNLNTFKVKKPKKK